MRPVGPDDWSDCELGTGTVVSAVTDVLVSLFLCGDW